MRCEKELQLVVIPRSTHKILTNSSAGFVCESVFYSEFFDLLIRVASLHNNTQNVHWLSSVDFHVMTRHVVLCTPCGMSHHVGVQH